MIHLISNRLYQMHLINHLHLRGIHTHLPLKKSLDIYILYTCSSLQVAHIPSAEAMIEQYDAMYDQSMLSLKEATYQVIDKERELQDLKDQLNKSMKSLN